MTVVLRLLLAPVFVAAASLVVRRFGPRIGGLVGGLPVVAGPILLVVTLDHGRRFGSDAANGTILGLIALACFVLVYARACGRLGWAPSLLLGWGGFAVAALVLSLVDVAPAAGLAVAWVAFAGVLLALPATDHAHDAELVDLPAWDLPVRGLAAAAMVVVLTAASDALGPEWSGLLTPFPVITTVLAVFTHAHHGPTEARVLLRGLVLGLYGFALFAYVLAVALRHLGTAPSFALALTACAAVLAALGLRAHRAVPRPHV
ncbi:MAG: hypothetical protein Q8K58_10935 [Acidimicrobiales bacterium]|nr:hypothetical protein [Acidimicrobiales bacterium]